MTLAEQKLEWKKMCELGLMCFLTYKLPIARDNVRPCKVCEDPTLRRWNPDGIISVVCDNCIEDVLRGIEK